MSKKTPANIALKLLISLIAVAFLGTIGCSSNSDNPVAAGLDAPLEMSAPAPFDAENGPGDLELAAVRSSQIVWYEYSESATEPNDDYTLAHPVYHAQAYNGYVDDDIDVDDYFRIDLSFVPASVYVQLSWTSDAWLNLYIYEEFDSVLTPVVYDNYDNPGPKELFEYQLDPGTYYIRVKAFEGLADYQIRFGIGRQYHEPANDTITGTTWNVTPPTDGPVRSVISNTEDTNDYMIINVTDSNTRIVAELDWLGLYGTNLNMTLYDSCLSVVTSIAGTGTPKTLISGSLTPGTYYLRIQATAGEAIYELETEIQMVFLPIDPNKFKIFAWRPWDPFPPDPPFQIERPGCPMDPVDMEFPHIPMQFNK